jgi:hypothetical protein
MDVNVKWIAFELSITLSKSAFLVKKGCRLSKHLSNSVTVFGGP